MTPNSILKSAANKLYKAAYEEGFTWGITRKDLTLGKTKFYISNCCEECWVPYDDFSDEELQALADWEYEDVPEYEFTSVML